MTNPSNPIEEFYAVTSTTVCKVKAQGPWRASAKEIARRDVSPYPLGTNLVAKNGMVAIGWRLYFYEPLKYGFGCPIEYERNPMEIGVCYPVSHSFPVIALFKDEAAARSCFDQKDGKPRDKRWLASTKQVLDEIGDDHPCFFVFKNSSEDLLSKRRRQRKPTSVSPTPSPAP